MKRFLGLGLIVLSALTGCARASAPAHTVASPQLKQEAVAPPVTASPRIAAAFIGEGSLEAKGEKTPKTKLALEALKVSAETTGDVAETTIEHVFRNDADEQLEGTFRFPVPEGAMLVGLSMEIDGKLMDGELVEREKARKAYEQIVDQMLDPALLEWENGRTFKLRVFPIEAKNTKRVVLKLVAPLHRSNDGLFFAYRPPSEGLAPEKITITIDGKSMNGSSKTATGEVLVKIASSAPEVVAEKTKDGTYLSAHVHPTFDGAAAPVPKQGQALIVMCDRSRSMLEARGLEAKLAGMLIAKLDTRDRFAVVTGDVRIRALAGLHEPTETERNAATAFIDANEPDGASDLAKLLGSAAELGKEAKKNGLEPIFVYLGDATPTWGETNTAPLVDLAKGHLGGAPLHVVLLGKSADDSVARALASATNGRLLQPKTEDDAKRAARDVISARRARRIEGLTLEAAEFDVPQAVPGTIYEGDDLVITAFLPKDKSASELKLVGTIGGKPWSKKIDATSASNARDVARQWAKAKIENLERDGDKSKEVIVKTSLEHGVMSRYTSFLVLESEEAYARMQIARKAKEQNGETRVTGNDLEGADRTASVSPDHLQPGDPEVRIPAPADAQSVVVVFPFGESKTAVFENDDRGGNWVARFLVDAHTPDGTYEIVVRITHKDGHVEILKLPYVVDTKQPNLDVTFVAKKNGAWEIHAKQRLTQEEIDAQAPNVAGTLDEKRRRLASVLTDAKRVEVRTPDGQVLSLVHVKLGEFFGVWTPNASFSPNAKLRVVAVDRALNERVIEVELPKAGK